MYLDKLKTDLQPSAYKTALRSINNWCNGSMMTISSIREANMKRFEQEDPPTNNDAGHEIVMPLRKQGSLFASMRAECMKRSEEMRLESWEKLQTFAEYVDFRIIAARSRAPSDEEIDQEVEETLGATRESIETAMLASYRSQALRLESQKNNVIAADSDYDDSIDFEQAECSMPVRLQHRMRVKVLDDIMRRCASLLNNAIKFKGQALEQTLKGEREEMLADALKVEDDMNVFERQHKAELDKEIIGTTRMMIYPTRDHLDLLEMVRKQFAKRKAA